MNRLNKGDTVTWKTSQGTIEGEVVRIVTSPVKIKGHTAKASKDKPEVLVRSRKTSAVAVHKPDALTSKRGA